MEITEMCAHEASRCPPISGSGVGRPQSTPPSALHFCISPHRPVLFSHYSCFMVSLHIQDGPRGPHICKAAECGKAQGTHLCGTGVMI